MPGATPSADRCFPSGQFLQAVDDDDDEGSLPPGQKAQFPPVLAAARYFPVVQPVHCVFWFCFGSCPPGQLWHVRSAVLESAVILRPAPHCVVCDLQVPGVPLVDRYFPPGQFLQAVVDERSFPAGQ